MKKREHLTPAFSENSERKRHSSFTLIELLVVSYIIIFPTVIGFCAWNAALSRVSLNVVSVMQYLSPVITMFLAYVMLGESLTWLQAIGAVLALSGVMIATVKPNSHKS